MSTFESESEAEFESELEEEGIFDEVAEECDLGYGELRELGDPAPSTLWRTACRKQLESTKVAVVGGGLAGLMAALRLRQQGIKVTVFEARSQVGGRVLSNTRFSNGRITEEGAELIGSFHTTWLALARRYGLTVISRSEPEFYQKADLKVKIRLGRELSMGEIIELGEKMRDMALKKIARDASQIRNPSRPWLESGLINYDKTSVAYALENYYKVPRDGLLWKLIELKLVNDEVAPLDEMNFLGLLCKVKGGQGKQFNTDLSPNPMGYWDELEIFRCADGCQTLAKKIAEELQAADRVQKLPPAKLHLSRAVTHINLSKQGVVLGSKRVVSDDGKLAGGPPFPTSYSYLILAIPPSVWGPPGVKMTVEGKPVNLDDDVVIGKMGMAPAVKFFTEVKERFWIKQKAAPYGGSLTLGQVWEGTDNQTRVGQQGIVLSVFAGPILPGPRVPTPNEFMKELRQLYPDPTGYDTNRIKILFSNWPNKPFIKTGYVSPRKGQIFTIGKKLSEPFHGRLFFAGEHTQMDFFGYMEGSLRSGKRAAEEMIRQACGLREEPAPASPSPPVRIASAAPIRETAF